MLGSIIESKFSASGARMFHRSPKTNIRVSPVPWQGLG
jgi:hypothetical protein